MEKLMDSPFYPLPAVWTGGFSVYHLHECHYDRVGEPKLDSLDYSNFLLVRSFHDMLLPSTKLTFTQVFFVICDLYTLHDIPV